MTAAEKINSAPETDARSLLERCCGSSRWITNMLAARPFNNLDDILSTAEKIWQACTEPDFLEAFHHHPKIGDVSSLRQKFAFTAQWASGEQAGVNAANEATIQGLAAGNSTYEKKFGFIFIVCATGKSAPEMLALLNARLPNDRPTELKNAAAEQAKITAIRLKKLEEPTP